jgi:hypothetical protein
MKWSLGFGLCAQLSSSGSLIRHLLPKAEGLRPKTKGLRPKQRPL